MRKATSIRHSKIPFRHDQNSKYNKLNQSMGIRQALIIRRHLNNVKILVSTKLIISSIHRI